MSITLFGLSAFVGFLVSGFYLWKRAREEHLPENEVFDAYIVISLWVLLTSRIAAIILHFDKFGFDPIRWLSIFTVPGLDGTMALVTAVLMVVLAAIKRKWDKWVSMDIFLPSILIWQSFIMSTIRWQMAIVWIIWSGLLWWMEREYRFWEWYRGRRANARPGLVSAVWLIGEGIGFCLLALFGGNVLSLGAFAALTILTGIVVVYVRSGRILKSDVSNLVGGITGFKKVFSQRRPKSTI